MADRLNVQLYPVLVVAPKPTLRGPILQRLAVFEREAEHLALAARQMRTAILSDQQRPLTEGVLNSRNWMLSVVWSHIFLQTALEPPYNYGQNPNTGAADPRAWVAGQFLVPRAVKAGIDDGKALRGF